MGKRPTTRCGSADWPRGSDYLSFAASESHSSARLSSRLGRVVPFPLALSCLPPSDAPHPPLAQHLSQDGLASPERRNRRPSKIPGADPRPAQRAQAFSGMNDGPATTASRLTGLTQKDVARDDASLYTSASGTSSFFRSASLTGLDSQLWSDFARLGVRQSCCRSRPRSLTQTSLFTSILPALSYPSTPTANPCSPAPRRHRLSSATR